MCMIGIFLQCTLESLMWHIAKTLAWKLGAAKTSSALALASFNDLDSMLDECQQKAWVEEERAAFQECTANPCAIVTVLFPHRSTLLFIHTRCLLTWRGRHHYTNTSFLFICTLSSFCFFDLSMDLVNS